MILIIVSISVYRYYIHNACVIKNNTRLKKTDIKKNMKLKKLDAKDSGMVSKIKWSIPRTTFLSSQERVGGEQINPNNPKTKPKNERGGTGGGESKVGCTFAKYYIQILVFYYTVFSLTVFLNSICSVSFSYVCRQEN